MKIIHKDQAEIWETETAKGYEYPFNTKNIDCALVEINGRYPLKGWCRNTKVDEMIFCKSGHGFLVLQNGIYELNENDAILISKNE